MQHHQTQNHQTQTKTNSQNKQTSPATIQN